jgi:hypothetical protein
MAVMQEEQPKKSVLQQIREVNPWVGRGLTGALIAISLGGLARNFNRYYAVEKPDLRSVPIFDVFNAKETNFLEYLALERIKANDPDSAVSILHSPKYQEDLAAQKQIEETAKENAAAITVYDAKTDPYNHKIAESWVILFFSSFALIGQEIFRKNKGKNCMEVIKKEQPTA